MAVEVKDIPKIQTIPPRSSQSTQIQAASDEQFIYKELPLDGHLITADDPALIGTNFQSIINMRPTNKSYRGVKGMSKINTATLGYGQDFATYTEVDVVANRLTVTSSTITVTALDNDENVYVVKDFGDNYFSGDFTFRLKVRVSSNASVGVYIWGLSSSGSSAFAEAGSYSLIVSWSSTGVLRITEVYGGSVLSSINSSSLSLDTNYYVEIIRNESAGANGTLTVNIYSDAAYTTLIVAATPTISRTLSGKVDFRYLYGVAQIGGAAGGVAFSGTIQNLTIILDIQSGFHLKKSQPAESIILVQAGDVSGTTSLFKNTTAIPNTGDFSAAPIFQDSPDAGLGRFAKAPDDQVAYCNGKDTTLWGGAEHQVSAFITSTAAITNTITNPRDYTLRVRNTSQDADQVAIIGGGAGTDCVLLCHMDTSAFIDAKTAKAVVVTGAVASTTFIKFGIASGFFDGVNDFISYADSADYNMADGKVTIDFWVKFNALPGALDEMGFCQQYQDATHYFIFSLYNNGSTYQPYVKIRNAGSSLLVGKGLELGLTSAQLVDGQFHHFAFTRGAGLANNWDIWVDGVNQAGTNQAFTWPDFTGAAPAPGFEFGRITTEAGTNKWLSAYADELRILQGTCYWTAPFTPMDKPYSDAASNIFVIGSTKKLKGAKFYLSSTNTVSATLAVKESIGSSWKSLSVTDNTIGFFYDELSVTWASTVNTSELRYLEGRLLYWYEFTLSAGDAEIYYVTVDAEMQQIIDTWDGVERPIVSAVKLIAAGTYTDFSLNVRDANYSAIDATNFDPSTYYNIGGLVAGDSLIFGFTSPMIGLVFAFIEGNINTTAATSKTVKRSTGIAAVASWTAVSNLADGTSISSIAFNRNGTTTWSPVGLASEFPVSINNGPSLYQYAVTFDKNLSANTYLYYVAGIPAPNNPTNSSFPLYTLNRLFLGKNNKVRYSAFDTASIFNGVDSGEVEFGDNSPIRCAVSLYSQFGSDLKSLSLFFKDTQTWACFRECWLPRS